MAPRRASHFRQAHLFRKSSEVRPHHAHAGHEETWTSHFKNRQTSSSVKRSTLASVSPSSRLRKLPPSSSISLLSASLPPTSSWKVGPFRKLPRLYAVTLRTRYYRYIQWQRDLSQGEILFQELYDHRSDPEEEDNLAAREPEVVKRLEELVAERQSVKR